MRFNLKKRNILILLFSYFAILIPPAHAYGGPGAAIGVIIVLITVILAFFSSLIIKIINLFKISLNKMVNYFSKKKKKSNSKK
tara:strand:- start:1605 stop:1853 length:249 start_codon:yes stop_codon:yes gene_type:complete